MDLYNRLSTKPATTNYLYNIALKKKILYVETPKVACTQIKRMLQRLEAGPSEILPKNIHDKEQSPLASPSNLGGDFFRYFMAITSVLHSSETLLREYFPAI